MNFKDCILGKIEAGTLNKQKGEALVNKFDKMTERYKSLGKSEDAAMLAAEDILKSESLLIEQRQRNLKQHAIKQKSINAEFDSRPGAIEKKVGDFLQNTYWRFEGVRKEAHQFVNEVADKLKINYASLNRDHAIVLKGVREALGESTGDGEAAKVGQAFRETFEYLHSRYKQAGGIIGKIDNYFPQVTRKESLVKAKISKEAFVEKTFNRLDREKMVDIDTGSPFSDEKLGQVLGDVYDTVMTAGRNKIAKRTSKGETVRAGPGDIDTRHADSRFLHFKSPDDFLAHNKEFGVGDQGLAQAFLEHVNSMSRDTAVLEKLGPRPNSIARFLDQKMDVDGTSPIKRKWANAMYRVLTSSFQHGDTDAMWWKVFAGSQNWLRSAKLGSASISAISDSTFIAATAKINGLDATRVMGNYFKGVAPGDRQIKQIAKRSGFIAEILGGSALGDTRFAGEAMGRGFTRALAGAVNEFSGLQHMTKAAQDAVSLEGMATLAEHISGGITWKDLNVDLKNNLGRFGFNEADWADLQKAEIYDSGDAKFLITSELRLDKNLSAKRAKDIADKLDDWTFFMRQMAANEPLLATRALTTGAILGDGGLATPSRVIGATLGLFKSFPVTVLLSHLLPAMKRAQVDRKMDHLAMTLVGTTLLGGLAMQLKQLTQGKTIKDMDSYKFWVGAAMQGGGLGLFSDFVFGDYSRFGRSPVTEAMGPTVGLFEDIMQATKGNLDKAIDGKDTNVARDLFRVAKGNIPLGNLWYARLALERLVLDNLERLTDPKFDSRIHKYQNKMQKETGQQFWWRPGQKAP